VIVEDVSVQVISAARPEWIHPFTGLKPAQFRRLVRLSRRAVGTPSRMGVLVGSGRLTCRTGCCWSPRTGAPT